jgi:hypothetical protein
MTMAVDWAEVTAIATAVLAVGALGAFAAAGFDFFEQLAALERQDAFDLELVKQLLGRTLIDRWELWRPALHAAHGPGVYPMFEGLAAKLREQLDEEGR